MTWSSSLKANTWHVTPSPHRHCPLSHHFRIQLSAPSASQPSAPTPTDRSKQAPYPDCRKPYHFFSEGARGWNTKPHSVCIDCYRAKRRRRRSQGPPSTPHLPYRPWSQDLYLKSRPNIQEMLRLPIHGVADGHTRKPQVNVKTTSTVTREHDVFTKGAWRRARLRDHTKIAVSISMDTSPSRNDSTPNSVVSNSKWLHTEFSCLGGRWLRCTVRLIVTDGVPRARIPTRPISRQRSPIPIEGAFFAQIATRNRHGKVVMCHSMVYVIKSVNSMYLSFATMFNLGILRETFSP